MKIRIDEICGPCLTERIASYNKKDVTKVSTNPIPLAARSKAIVRDEATLYIFIVDNKTYIPALKNKITGIFVYIFEGNKNQNIPTPRVKSIGSINETRVMLRPIPSKNDQNEKRPLNITSKNMAMNLYGSFKY